MPDKVEIIPCDLRRLERQLRKPLHSLDLHPFVQQVGTTCQPRVGTGDGAEMVSICDKDEDGDIVVSIMVLIEELTAA